MRFGKFFGLTVVECCACHVGGNKCESFCCLLGLEVLWLKNRSGGLK